MNEPIVAVAWDDCHRIGLDEIDREHEWIVNDFNTMINEFRTVTDRRLIEKIFDGFVNATVSHFAHEEASMIQYGFDDVETHRNSHALYCGHLARLRIKVYAGIDVTDALLDFFTSWTTIHITKTDRKFGDFLKARKLTDPQVKILTATTTW